MMLIARPGSCTNFQIFAQYESGPGRELIKGRISGQYESSSLNRSDFEIERDHFMNRNRGHIDGDETALSRKRNWPACHQ